MSSSCDPHLRHGIWRKTYLKGEGFLYLLRQSKKTMFEQRLLIGLGTALVAVLAYRYFFKRKTKEQIELEKQYSAVVKQKTASQWEQ